MPCSDYNDGSYERDMKKTLDMVTALLCATLKQVEHAKRSPSNGLSVVLPDNIMAIPGMLAWWTEHQRLDKLRKAEDRRRKARELRQLEREHEKGIARMETLRAELNRGKKAKK